MTINKYELYIVNKFIIRHFVARSCRIIKYISLNKLEMSVI